jgi:hypothetical protein
MTDDFTILIDAELDQISAGGDNPWLNSTVGPRFIPSAYPRPCDLYARERYMNWGNLVRSSAVVIG